MTFSSTEVHKDNWSDATKQYGTTVVPISIEAAKLVVNMANEIRPISSSSRVLDVGAGTGAVTMTIASAHSGADILATDYAQGMLDSLKLNLENATDKAAGANVSTSIMDTNAIKSSCETSLPFTHIFSNFVIQLATKTPVDVLRQMLDILEPGGVAGVGIWGPNSDPMNIMGIATQKIDPDFIIPAPYPDEKAWLTPEELEAGMTKAGFVDIKAIFKTVPFVFPSGEAFAKFWFGAKNPALDRWTGKWKTQCEKAGRDPDGLVEVVEQVVNEEFDGGAAISIDFTLAVGLRPLES